METTPKEIILKLHRKVARDFMPIGEALRAEGKDDHDILITFNNHVNGKIKQYYTQKSNNKYIGITISGIPTIINPDSKAEAIFGDVLTKHKIPYEFQYKIGPYRADYLVSDFLVVEIDGPIHWTDEQKEHDIERDKYIKKMGYKILRLPIWLIAMSQKAIMEEINDLINSRKEKGLKCII